MLKLFAANVLQLKIMVILPKIKKTIQGMKQILTITMTFVMLLFTFQFSIIQIIDLNETLTKSMLQSPISEEEEEEEEEDGLHHGKHVKYIHSLNRLFLTLGTKSSTVYFITNSSKCPDLFLKSINEPPESIC